MTIETNLKQAKFFCVTLNLTTGTYKPCRKSNDHPTYINTRSKHPPNVIKQLPRNTGKRISENSASKEIFEQCHTTTKHSELAATTSRFNFSHLLQPPMNR